MFLFQTRFAGRRFSVYQERHGSAHPRGAALSEKRGIMDGITLEELLAAKENRALRRERMQAEHPGTCLSLSVNMPGPEKDSPRIRALFRHALLRIGTALPVAAALSVQGKAGPHAVLAVEAGAEAAKEAAVALESERPWGRLLDIDVYGPSGAAVSSPARGPGRTCFLCPELAVACMRERRHTPEAVMAGVEALFTAFHADMSRDVSEPAARLASLGLEAMLHEAASAPSPGLVDPFHSGSHADMDFFTFQRSSAALASGLARCAEAGIRHGGEPRALLPVLRAIGVEAEQAMFRATNGVNTQKGLLFSLGLALGAAGLLVRDGTPVTPEAVSALLREMAAGLVARELGGNAPRTAGERMYRDFGISGIRGEVEAGLPSVLGAGLPTLENALARGEGCNRALIRALVALMAEVDDTTILARSPRLESLRTVQEKAREVLRSGLLDRDSWQDALWALDAAFVKENLSPGGSADLLALTWFLHRARDCS